MAFHHHPPQEGTRARRVTIRIRLN
ncbi:hypothetical protein CBM2587_B100077 [Cupriavidus taiwanensis]|uniref:Uncharacterized protein n=1 Tax=Cupriavidus taiwanensis TaxID=164546 RepID=A0A976A469_9BURK|nr:hypothetical protein CBM2587_B100077 [Cupriavidus taiwanensis]